MWDAFVMPQTDGSIPPDAPPPEAFPTDAEWIRRALDDPIHDLDTIVPSSSDGFVAALAPAFSELAAARSRFQSFDNLAQAHAADAAWHLLWDACNALIAAFVLLRRGYQSEPMGVARGVLERVACAIVIFDNPSRLPRFAAGKLKAVDMIGPAGKVITQLAEMHGHFSRLGAHVAMENIGTSVIARSHMAIGGRFSVDPRHQASLGAFVQDLYAMAGLLTSAPQRILFDPKRRRATLLRGR